MDRLSPTPQASTAQAHPAVYETAPKRKLQCSAASLTQMLKTIPRNDLFFTDLQEWTEQTHGLLRSKTITDRDVQEQGERLQQILNNHEGEEKTLLEVLKKHEKAAAPKKVVLSPMAAHLQKLREEEEMAEKAYQEEAGKISESTAQIENNLAQTKQLIIERRDAFQAQSLQQKQVLKCHHTELLHIATQITQDIAVLAQENKNIASAIPKTKEKTEELKTRAENLNTNIQNLQKKADEIREKFEKETNPFEEFCKIAIPIAVAVLSVYLLGPSCQITVGKDSIGFFMSA